MPKTALLALPLMAIFYAVSVPAAATVTTPHPVAAPASGDALTPLLVAQKKKPKPQVDRRIIACRPGGCFRIPLGCYTEPEYDFWDNPTGNDKIICPRR